MSMFMPGISRVWKSLDSPTTVSSISDEDIDIIVKDYVERHGSTTGEPFMSGYFVSKGIHVQQRRIRASINYVDPRNVALRGGSGGEGGGAVLSQKVFRSFLDKM